MLLLAALLLLPTAVSADEPEYTFVLTADGADSCRAAAGDIVTVTLAVRCDSGTDAVYAAQDEIVFDPAFFAFEPDSVLTRSGVKTSTLHLRDGRQAVYMSFISYGSAADWAGRRFSAPSACGCWRRTAPALCAAATTWCRHRTG